jgi:hypothetical protein
MRRGDGYIPRWLAWLTWRRRPDSLDVVVIRLRPARDCLEAWNKEEPRHHRAMLWEAREATLFVAIPSVRGGESMSEEVLRLHFG